MEGDFIPPDGDNNGNVDIPSQVPPDGGGNQPDPRRPSVGSTSAAETLVSSLGSKTPIPPWKVETPKSRIPIPSSIYVAPGFRANYLTGLSDKVYREGDDDEDEEELAFLLEKEQMTGGGGGGSGGKKRKRRRDRRSSRTTDGGGDGPPGILHEKRDGRSRRRRDSDEFGDSSVELLGPTETLDTDESDGSGELLSGKENRAGSASHDKRGKKRRSPVKKSKTVGGGQDTGSEDEDEDEERDKLGARMKITKQGRGKKQGRPPSSRPGKGKGGEDKERKGRKDGKWDRVEPSRPKSKTPTSKSPSRSPAGRSPGRGGGGGGGGLQDLKKHLAKTVPDKKKAKTSDRDRDKKGGDNGDKWRVTSKGKPRDRVAKLMTPTLSIMSGSGGSSGEEDKSGDRKSVV